MNRANSTVDIDEVPEEFNAASYFIDRHIEQGRGEKIALIDDRGSYRYAELFERTNRAANALTNLGLRQEARIAMAVLDCGIWRSVAVRRVPGVEMGGLWVSGPVHRSIPRLQSARRPSGGVAEQSVTADGD